MLSGPGAWPEGGRWGRPALTVLTRSSLWQREVDRNQELLTRIRQLQDREAEAEEKMKEQLEHNRQCKQSLDAANKRLREKEDGLAEAGEVRGRVWCFNSAPLVLSIVITAKLPVVRSVVFSDSVEHLLVSAITIISGWWDCFLSVSDALVFYTHTLYTDTCEAESCVPAAFCCL